MDILTKIVFRSVKGLLQPKTLNAIWENKRIIRKAKFSLTLHSWDAPLTVGPSLRCLSFLWVFDTWGSGIAAAEIPQHRLLWHTSVVKGKGAARARPWKRRDGRPWAPSPGPGPGPQGMVVPCLSEPLHPHSLNLPGPYHLSTLLLLLLSQSFKDSPANSPSGTIGIDLGGGGGGVMRCVWLFLVK